MADINNKFILSSVANLTGFKEAIKAMSETEVQARRLSQNVTRESKFLSGTIKESFTKSGKSVETLSAVFDDNGDKIRVVARDTGNGFKRVSESVTEISKSTKKARPFTDDFVQALRRVLVVVPIWASFRFIISSVTNLIRSSIRFLREWEFQLAQIRLVGSATNEEISRLSNSLLSLATSLGISNRDLGEGAKLFIQQGRAISEIIPLMDAVSRLSLLTGRNVTQSVEDLTAVLKAYNLEATDAISVVDAVTNVMLNNAITAGDLASAYKQVASTAAALGISLSSLTGFITAVREETRDSGNKIGTAFRTIFTRISSISAEAIQELSKVPLFLDDTGKATTQVTPNLRNLDSVITELALQFGNLSNAQQVQLATLIGGVRRVNQVIALFNNFNTAIEAQTDALFGLGEADEAVGKLTDTLELRIQSLQNRFDELVNTVGDTGIFKRVLEGLEDALSNLQATLSPVQTLNVQVNERVNEQVNSLNQRLNFVKSTLEALDKVDSLSEILERRPGDINRINEQVQSLFRGIEEGAEKIGVADINLPDRFINAKQLEEIRSNLESQLEDIDVSARIRIEEIIPRGEIAGIASDITELLDLDSLINVPGFLSEFSQEFEKAISRIQLLQLGEIIDLSEFNELRTLIERERANLRGGVGFVSDEDIDKAISGLDRIGELINKSNSAFEKQNEFRENFNKTQDNILEGLLTEQQIDNKLVDLKRRIATEGLDRLDAIREEIDLLERANQLSDAQSNRLDTLRNQEAQVQREREILRLQIRQEQILDDLRSSGASNLQIAIQELAFLEQINAQEEQRLNKVKEINSLISSEQDNIINTLVQGQAEILRLQGESETNVIRQTIELESQLGIQRQGIDLVKQRLDLIKAIAQEEKRTREDRLRDLQREVERESRAQSPAVQQRLDVQEARLRARAEALGIDADQFLNVPELEDVKLELSDLPLAFKNAVSDPLETSMTSLTSAIQDLSRRIISQQTSGLFTNQTVRSTQPQIQTQPITGGFTPFSNFSGVSVGGTQQVGGNILRDFNIRGTQLSINISSNESDQRRFLTEALENKFSSEFIPKVVDEILNQLRDPGSQIGQEADNRAFRR